MQCPLQRQVVCRKTGSIRSFGQRSQVSRHMCSRARCSARKPVQERLGEVEGWATKPAEEGLAEAQAWPVKPPHEGPAGPEVWQRRRPSADVWQVRESRHMQFACTSRLGGLFPLVPKLLGLLATVVLILQVHFVSVHCQESGEVCGAGKACVVPAVDNYNYGQWRGQHRVFVVGGKSMGCMPGRRACGCLVGAAL